MKSRKPAETLGDKSHSSRYGFEHPAVALAYFRERRIETELSDIKRLKEEKQLRLLRLQVRFYELIKN